MNYAFLLLLALSVIACSEAPQSTERPAYFDVAGYVASQIKILSEQKPSVAKRLQMRGKVEQQTSRAINWSRELELFMQADINKPALRGSYAIAHPDSLTYRYTLKPTEKNLAVRSLTVKLDSITRKPLRIEAVLVSENSLYTAEKQILLESGPKEGNNWGIISYHLSGFQHLSISDKNTFDVKGTISR